MALAFFMRIQAELAFPENSGVFMQRIVRFCLGFEIAGIYAG